MLANKFYFKTILATCFFLLYLIAELSGTAYAGDLRKFPYPFTNMIAIMSDTDLSDKDEFENMHRFLNTEEDCGPMGKGVGLDVGDTFWMDLYHGNDKDNWRINSKGWSWIYWHDGVNRYGNLMQKYIKAGWIDIPHTFFSYFIGADPNVFDAAEDRIFKEWDIGANLSTFRAQVEKVLKEWRRIGYKPVAWADHSNNPWNILNFQDQKLQRAAHAKDNVIVLKNSGALPKLNDILSFPVTGEVCQVAQIIEDGNSVLAILKRSLLYSYGMGEQLKIHGAGNFGPTLGAVAGSPYYCIDLALQAGIKFFWTRPPYDIAKQTDSGKRGHPSSILPVQLSDGTKVWGYLRYYEQPEADNGNLGKCLNRILVGDEKGGPIRPWTYSIVTTHLGYVRLPGELLENDVYSANKGRWFNAETVESLRALRSLQDKGKMLVANTSRLLKYNLANDMLSKYANSLNGYTKEKSGHQEKIIIHKITDDVFGPFVPELDDVRGITFYSQDPDKLQIFIGDKKIESSELQVNPPDQSGCRSIGIRWFKRETTDYTKR